MEMEEEYQEGVSFGRIIKVAFHRWKLLLCITLGIGIIGFFGLYFGYNALFNVYNTTFSYTGSGLASETKADNTTLNYKNLISKNILNEVKATKEEYKDIDVDKIIKSNALSISRNANTESKEITYTISIKRNQMPSFDIAKNFFTDLANYPLQNDKKNIDNSTFDSSLVRAQNASNYEDAIDLMYTHATSLITGYEAMEELLSANSSTIKTEISINVLTINKLIDEEKTLTLKSAVINYGLAPDYTKIDVDYLNEQKNVLNGEKANNEAIIDDLSSHIKDLGASAAVTSLGEKMESLIIRNNAIDQEIKKNDKQIANYNKPAEEVEGNAQFVKDLKNKYDGLYKEIESYKSIMEKVYVNNAEVAFSNSNVVEVTKNMNAIYSIIIPVAAGLLIAIVTNLIIDRKMLHDEENIAEQTEK